MLVLTVGYLGTAAAQDCYGSGVFRPGPKKPCTCDEFGGFYGKGPFCKWCGRFASYKNGKCECQAGYLPTPNKNCKNPDTCGVFYDAVKAGSSTGCKCRAAALLVPLTTANKAFKAVGPHTPTCACDTAKGAYPSYQPYAASRSPCTLCFDTNQVVVTPKTGPKYCGCKKGSYISLGAGPACRPCSGKNEVAKGSFCRCKPGYYVNTGVQSADGKGSEDYCVPCKGKGLAANSNGQCDCDFTKGYYQNGEGWPCYACNDPNAIEKKDWLKRKFCTCKAGYWGTPAVDGCKKCPPGQTSTPCNYQGCYATCTCKDKNALADNNCNCKPGYTKDSKGVCKPIPGCSTNVVKVTAWEGSTAAAAYIAEDNAVRSSKALAKLKAKGSKTFKAGFPWKLSVEKGKSPTFYSGLKAPFAAKLETCACFKTGSIELVTNGLAATLVKNDGFGKFLGNSLTLGFKSAAQKNATFPDDYYEKLCNKLVLWIFVKSAPASVQVNIYEAI